MCITTKCVGVPMCITRDYCKATLAGIKVYQNLDCILTDFSLHVRWHSINVYMQYIVRIRGCMGNGILHKRLWDSHPVGLCLHSLLPCLQQCLLVLNCVCICKYANSEVIFALLLIWRANSDLNAYTWDSLLENLYPVDKISTYGKTVYLGNQGYSVLKFSCLCETTNTVSLLTHVHWKTRRQKHLSVPPLHHSSGWLGIHITH